jgi:hypothetical protein
MEKDAKIQIRIDSESKVWLKKYADSNKVTISRIFVDFIDWLKKREESKNV